LFPVLFHFYGYEIHTYPILILIGFILSAYYFTGLCYKYKLMLKFINDYLIIITINTFLIGRIGGILESLNLYTQDPIRILNILDGNYCFFSAFIGCVLSIFIIALFKKENFWKWLDVLSESFLLLMVFVKTANFLSGKSYGSPSSLPWAISYNIPEVRYTIPVHPVQIYELILIVLLIFLIKYIYAKKKYNGVVASYAFLFYFVVTALMSMFKGAPELLLFKIPISIMFSVMFSAVFLIILIFRTHPNIHFLHHH